MRVVVLGGTGFLGRRTVEALRRVPGAEVLVASRRGPVAVDVERPETFDALAGADVILDLSDGTRARPDALARWCLARDLTLLEATSDAAAIARLRALPGGGPGRLVLGGGIFTGMSNLLARDVANACGAGCSLTWAVSTSPYSGAGRGTISLMVDGVARPAVSTRRGRRVEGPLARGPVVDIAGVPRPTLRASFAEAEMLPHSTGAAEVEVLFAPRPSLLVTAFVLLPPWLLARRWFRAILEGYFTVLRRWLLRSVPTSVQMVARAERDGRASARHLTAADGMSAGAWALAAMTETLASSPPAPGVCFIDDVATLDAILARANALAGVDVMRVTPAA